ncbi:ribonuclease III [Candidatus Kaiserbacteria bacterium RIFCSPHIGHO2_02_FULL_49_34]|uniref:Ribonuclease 3 n=1 Tax=Candidatus Kaiserbacteria bacterium RIFCSPHIGHO2_02_FULL_49_34 TaxID=1798491 RepID=A0A1F6DIK1_9BACT|nr:MAG: ribonuclease III [Candidatus Kaiserbacteria bacterium RIFCSPHIGHO2_02_FULL_49_34]
MKYSVIEELLGVTFLDKTKLLTALTHRSYLNEHREAKQEHNERYEFLGDAVLELIVTDYLFREYPHKPEGELTAIRSALVNTVSLADASTRLGLGDYLLMSKGETKDTGRARQYLLADVFEAIAGAIFLDQGYDAARDYIARNLFEKTKEIVEKELWKDAKSRFQERAQDKVSITPTYETIRQTGPDHARQFVIGAFLGSNLIAEGEGFSKQEAEQVAAERALAKQNW